jgi:hypothetical protein
LASGSLISIGQLCDHGCTALFTATTVEISFNSQIILQGNRSHTTKLWTLDLPSAPDPTTPESANAMVHNPNIAERIAFYHASLFSPAITTWCEPIDAGHLTTWPALTSAQVRRHPPDSKAMVQGHLNQQRANIRSTKPKSVTFPTTSDSALPKIEHYPTPEPANVITESLYADCQAITGKIFTDPTGRFLVPSTTGNAYMLVLYEYDSNFIHVEPMKNRTKEEHLAAYRRAITLFQSRGLSPKLQRLDNEASGILQQFMRDSDIDYQLVPPGLHRQNASEQAIRTFKNHFIAGLCTTDPNFPLILWDRLLPQALITLNLLRTSRINPRLSAWAQVHGLFDFNRTPLAPPGTRVLVHEKPDLRGTWSPHAVDGWYLGPAMNHYRCDQVWITKTTAERTADTVVWFPAKVKMPALSSVDTATSAAQELITALQNPSAASPIAPISTIQQEALKQLAQIFSTLTMTEPTTAVPPGFAPLTPDILRPNPTLTAPPLPRVSPSPIIDTPLPRVSPPIPVRPTTTTSLPPQSTDTTYHNSTGNAGRCRRLKARQQRAKKNAIPPTSPAPSTAWTTVTRSTARRLQQRKQPNRLQRGHIAIPNHSANLLLPATPRPIPTPTVQSPPATSLPLPAHAYWTANAVVDPTTGASLEYAQLKLGPDAEKWIQSAANEIGRLTEGVQPHMPTGTETIHFIHPDDKPPDRKATYLRVCANYRPQKAEPERI